MAEAIFVVYAHIAKIANIVNVNIEFNMDQMTQRTRRKQEPREVGSERQKGSDQQREVNTEYQPVNLDHSLLFTIPYHTRKT